MRLRSPTRPPHDPSGLRAGVLAAFQDLHAVDEDVAHAGGELLRLVERGVVRDLRRIEDDEIGEAA